MMENPLRPRQQALAQRIAATRDMVMLYEQRVTKLYEQSRALELVRDAIPAVASTRDATRCWRVVLGACGRTRVCWVMLQDPWLLPLAVYLQRESALPTVVNTASWTLVQTIALLEHYWQDLSAALAPGCLEQGAGYLRSMKFRGRQATLYLAGDGAAFDVMLRDEAGLAALQDTPEDADDFSSQEAEVSAVLATAALWALSQKLSGIVVEYEHEKGPMLDALEQHYQIAETAVDACRALVAAARQGAGAKAQPTERYLKALSSCDELAAEVEQKLRQPLGARIAALKAQYGPGYTHQSCPGFDQNEQDAGLLIERLKQETDRLLHQVDPLFLELRSKLPAEAWEEWRWLGVQDQTEEVPAEEGLRVRRAALRQLVACLPLRRNARRLAEWVQLIRATGLTLEDGATPDRPALALMDRLLEWDPAEARRTAATLLIEENPWFARGTFEMELAGCLQRHADAEPRTCEQTWLQDVFTRVAAQPLERYGDEFGRGALLGSLGVLILVTAPAGPAAVAEARDRLLVVLTALSREEAQIAVQFLCRGVADLVERDAREWTGKWLALAQLRDRLGLLRPIPEIEQRMDAARMLLEPALSGASA